VLIELFNQGIMEAIQTGQVGVLQPLCSAAFYPQMTARYHGWKEQGVQGLILQKFDLISFNITAPRVEAAAFVAGESAPPRQLEACTYEKWIFVHQDGRQVLDDGVNCYVIAWEDGLWKMDGVEIFARTH